MFQNKKLKRNTTYAIAEVAEVALCASNCALPTSDCFILVETCLLNDINYAIGLFLIEEIYPFFSASIN